MAVDTRRYLSIDEATGRGKFIRAIQTSAGAGDADKIFALDSAGKIDPSFLYAVSVVEPANQIVYGTGTGVDSSSAFTYNPTTGGLVFAPASNAAPANVSVAAASSSAAGVVGGSAYLTSGNGTTTGDGGLISIASGTGGGTTGAGGSIFLITGNGGPTSGASGSISLEVGNSGGTTAGGNIVLSAGLSAGGTGGFIRLRTGNSSQTERLRILSNGAWSVGSTGSDYGTAGQALVSNGSSSAPTWQSVSISEPANQIVYGTGTGVDSSSTFTYNASTGGLIFNPGSVASPANVAITASDNSTTNGVGAGVYITSGAGNANGASGPIQIVAGSAGASGTGGAITITGGPSGSSVGGNGGAVTITGGSLLNSGGASGAVLILGGQNNANTGSTGGSVTVRGGSSTPAGSTGGTATLIGGTPSDGTGGSAVLSGADGVGTNRPGGHATIKAGARTGTGTAGSIKLVIPATGDLQINTNAGGIDMVLTSKGPNVAPVWQAAFVVEPASRIVYGTGTGIDSSSTFTYDVTTGAFTLNPGTISGATATLIKSATTGTSGAVGPDMTIQAGGGNAGGSGGTTFVYGGSSGNTSGSGGAVYIRGGQAIGTTGAGGAATLVGGTGASPNGYGGDVSILGGTGNGSAGGGAVFITGGDTSSGQGGDVVIGGGHSSSGAKGTVQLKTNNAIRFLITTNGAFSIGGTSGYGTSGQVFMSQGSAAPIWQTLDYLGTSGGTLTGALTLNADPTLPLHAATKQYVDNLYAGLDPKANVRVATTANINLSSAPASIDGVTLSSGNRVLVKDQSTGSQNGIYVFNGAGSAMTRSTDADGSPANEVTSGMYCFAIEGTANSESGWLLTTSDPITVGTTALTFAQFNVGGGGSPGGSTYQLQYNNAGVFGALAFGTTGQVLTSAGNGALATWSDPTVTFANVTSTPTTLAGYGITNAYTQDEVLALIIALG